MQRAARPLARTLAGGLILLALVAACAPAQPPAPSAPQAAGQSAPPAPARDNAAAPAGQAAAPAAVQGSGPAEWVVALAEEPASLDPAVGTAAAASSMAQLHLYDALVAYEGPSMKLVGKLAESWRLVDDSTWEFNLRQGVRFHNGDPFTAEDVRYSFGLYKDEKAARRINLEAVTGWEVLDPSTIRLRTAGPSPGLLANLASLTIMPRGAREQAGADAFGERPIGTGPYRFVEFARGQRLVLEANTDYWRGKPTPPRLVLRPITDPATRAAELKTGSAQVVAAPALAQLKELQGGGTEVLPLKGGRLIMLPFNTTAAPFDDPRVRQAANYAVDRQAILTSILEGYGELLHGPFASAWQGYDPALQPYPYDPAKARQLLAEAGYPNGFETTFSVSNGAFVKDREIAEVIASQLAQVGIKVQLVPTERAKLQEDWLTGTFRGITSTAWGTTADPDAMIAWALYKRKGHKPDDQLNALIDQSRRTLDPEQRRQVLQQLGRYIHDQAYWLFIHAQDEFYARRADVPWVPYPSGQSFANVQYYLPFDH
jgi:peptide/nickel transport system substrate-binding protein